MNLLRHTITGIAVLLLSAVLIVGNTLRLNILNQRSEIEVLKLVGSDRCLHPPSLPLYGHLVPGSLAACWPGG